MPLDITWWEGFCLLCDVQKGRQRKPSLSQHLRWFGTRLVVSIYCEKIYFSRVMGCSSKVGWQSILCALRGFAERGFESKGLLEEASNRKCLKLQHFSIFYFSIKDFSAQG